jgi:hypothetical protein
MGKADHEFVTHERMGTRVDVGRRTRIGAMNDGAGRPRIRHE